MAHRPRRDARVKPFHQRYVSYPVGQDRQKLPLLHVRLIGDVDTLTTIALVDSGATTTFIPPELAEAVVLRVVERDVSAIGAGGSFLNDVCEFEVELLKKAETIYRIKGEAHVPKETGKLPYVVLGRDYLFEIYDITFRERKQLVVLRPATGP